MKKFELFVDKLCFNFENNTPNIVQNNPMIEETQSPQVKTPTLSKKAQMRKKMSEEMLDKNE